MTARQLGISVVIPGYNGRDLLPANLASVRQALQTSEIADSEIIVADDASTDGSADWVAACAPDVRLIRGETNVGFAGNVNRGIRAATKDLVLLLNTDVLLAPGYFKPLLRHFERPDTFGVMARMDAPGGAGIRDGAKYPRVGFASIRTNGNYVRDPDDGAAETLTLYLSGANALVDRRKLQALGGFAEAFNPYYFEDVDLGLRAWKAGYRCVFEPAATAVHALSSTIKKQPSERIRLVVARNKILLHYVHLDGLGRAFFLWRQAAKALLGLLVGRPLAWRARKEFAARKAAAQELRNRIRAATPPGSLPIRTRDVAATIKAAIGGAAIRRF